MRIQDLRRVLLAVLVVLPACGSGEPDVSGAPTPPRPLRALVHGLNSIGVAFDVAGQTLDVSIRYPEAQVFIIHQDEGRERRVDVFDQVYTIVPVDIVDGSSAFWLWGMFEKAFPGHTLASAVTVKNGTLHFRTEDNYLFFVSAEGRESRAAMDEFRAVLADSQPLAEGYFPVVRLRQLIDREWTDLRRFGHGTFKYYLAPTDSVRLELAAFLLQVKYYADRVELSAAGSESREDVKVGLRAGLNGVPTVMREVDGLVLSPGEVWQLAFPYREFDPNAEIDIFVQRDAESKSMLPAGDVQGDVDIFPSFAMGDHPVDLIPGSPAYKDVTRRTPQLDSLLQLRGASYPPNDQEFPQWAKERDAQLFPRSHSK